MKKLLLALLALPMIANATNYLQPSSGVFNTSATSEATSEAHGGSVGAISNTSSGGNSSVNVDNDTKMPASSAISPSVGTMNDCQIATPSSKAFSVLIFSASGTTGVTYNDLCFAYKMKQFDIAEQLMCEKSQDYAKANAKCKK